MNKVLLSGKLTRKVLTGGDKTVACFITVACQGNKGRHDLIDIAAFQSTAGYINKYLTEGDYITAEGHLHYNSEKKKLEVIAEEVHCIAHGRTWQEVQ